MVQFSVREEERPNPEKKVFFELMPTGDGGVLLLATDETGNDFGGGNILTLHPGKPIELHQECEVPGLPTCSKGIVLVKDEP